MANAEHVEIVQQGADAIVAFRVKNPDVQLVLSVSNLRLSYWYKYHIQSYVRADHGFFTIDFGISDSKMSLLSSTFEKLNASTHFNRV